jgi:hypothetical protein
MLTSMGLVPAIHVFLLGSGVRDRVQMLLECRRGECDFRATPGAGELPAARGCLFDNVESPHDPAAVPSGLETRTIGTAPLLGSPKFGCVVAFLQRHGTGGGPEPQFGHIGCATVSTAQPFRPTFAAPMPRCRASSADMRQLDPARLTAGRGPHLPNT